MIGGNVAVLGGSCNQGTALAMPASRQVIVILKASISQVPSVDSQHVKLTCSSSAVLPGEARRGPLC